MNWNHSAVFRFIDIYRKYSILWDPLNEDHRNRFKLNQAWERLQKELGMACTLNDLKRKKKSLMSTYRAYRTRIKKCELEGETFKPTWPFYDTMDSFMGAVYTGNVTHQTEAKDTDEGEDSNEDDEEEKDIKIPKIKKVISLTTRKRLHTPEPRQDNTKDQQTAKASCDTKPMDEGVSFTKPVSLKLEDSDDECSTFGLLIAKKLRKLPDDRRDVMMVKINQLFVDEHNARNDSTHPHSTSSMFHVSSPFTSCNDPLLLEVDDERS